MEPVPNITSLAVILLLFATAFIFLPVLYVILRYVFARARAIIYTLHRHLKRQDRNLKS